MARRQSYGKKKLLPRVGHIFRPAYLTTCHVLLPSRSEESSGPSSSPFIFLQAFSCSPTCLTRPRKPRRNLPIARGGQGRSATRSIQELQFLHWSFLGPNLGLFLSSIREFWIFRNPRDWKVCSSSYGSEFRVILGFFHDLIVLELNREWGLARVGLVVLDWRCGVRAMADSWMKEFQEAARLAEEIEGRIAEKNALPPHSSEGTRIVSVTRRKLAVLNNKLDRLESLLQISPLMGNLWVASIS